MGDVEKVGAREESRSDDESESDDDDLAMMMQFVGDKSLVEEKRKQNLARTEDATTKATREVVLQHRKETAKKENVQRMNELKKLTLQNLGAASSMWDHQEQEDEESSDVKGTVAIPAKEEEAQQMFTSVVDEGKRLILAKDLEGAVEKLREGLVLCKSFPHKALWRGTLEMTIGATLLRLGETRQAIRHLLNGLQVVRLGHSESFDSRPLQKQILSSLVKAHAEIGKTQDAQSFQKQLDALTSAGTVGEKSKQESLADLDTFDYKSLPKDLQRSLDQALEAARDGQLGFLRALLHAFRSGRSGVAVNVVASYPHSQTGATPLMLASARGDLGLIRALLYAGAPCSQVANNGTTALEWAAQFNKPEAVKLLLDSGAIFDSSLSADTLMSWSPEVQTTIATFVSKKKQEAAQQSVKPSSGHGKPKAAPAQQPIAPATGDDGFQAVTKKGKKGKGAKNGKDRNLEKWDEAQTASKQGTLESETHDKDWDQFKANEELGVKTNSFDENLYTTKLDLNSIPAEVREQAEALAKNIETGKSAERNVSDDYDEEAAYSAVLRKEGDVGEDDGWTDVSVRKKKNSKKGNRAGSK